VALEKLKQIVYWLLSTFLASAPKAWKNGSEKLMLCWEALLNNRANEHCKRKQHCMLQLQDLQFTVHLKTIKPNVSFKKIYLMHWISKQYGYRCDKHYIMRSWSVPLDQFSCLLKKIQFILYWISSTMQHCLQFCTKCFFSDAAEQWHISWFWWSMAKERQCGTWCKYGTDPTSCYRSLPYHKPLSDEPLRDALDALIVKYVAKADSLSAIGSSQANESFNQMVSSKAPKNKFV